MPRCSQAGVAFIFVAASIAPAKRTVPAVSLELAFYMQAAPGSEKKKDEGAKAAAQVQVRGRVVDRNGKGLANIEVTISGPNGAATSATTRTESSGSFVFTVRPGKYTISATADNKSTMMVADLNENKELPTPLVLDTEQ
jgi:hypothetical protein